MKKQDKRLINAIHYLSYCYKEGVLDKEPEEIRLMTPEEKIAYAEGLMNKADAYYEAVKEQGIH